jgi:predicted transposase YbfD/YdcC
MVTIDAIRTQTEMVKQIRHKKADYIVSLKANHPTLHCQVKEWFDTRRANNFEGINVSYNQQPNKGHPRTEKRYVWAVPLDDFGGLYQQDQWSGLQTIVIIEGSCHLWNKTTHEIHFYLTSLPADAQVLGRAIRQHWTIENQVHWTLDVTFHEDQCRISSGDSPRNFAILRRMALNALNQEKTLQRSLRQKIKQASMNNDYMMTVLNSFCQA